jgi:hypothetical protein
VLWWDVGNILLTTPDTWLGFVQYVGMVHIVPCLVDLGSVQEELDPARKPQEHDVDALLESAVVDIRWAIGATLMTVVGSLCIDASKR